MADREITFEAADNGGSIKIANEVVMTIASQAVSEVKGVTVASTLAEGIVDMIVKKNSQRGIRINTDEATGLTDVDVHINVAYGIHILETSWAVQEAVRKNITMMTDVKLGKVNVFVDGIILEKEPKPQKVKEEKEDKKDKKEN